MTSSDKEYDDLSDLNSMEMESVKEWEIQFRGIYLIFLSHVFMLLYNIPYTKLIHIIINLTKGTISIRTLNA